VDAETSRFLVSVKEQPGARLQWRALEQFVGRERAGACFVT
jgi:hypothetical protein